MTSQKKKSNNEKAVACALNKGQKQKLIKNEAVKALLDRYEVNYGG